MRIAKPRITIDYVPVPTRRDFGRLLRSMDLPARARLSTKARSGEVADDPDEAALIAATARRELVMTRWAIMLAVALAGFNVVSVLVMDDPRVRWMGVAVILLVAVAIIVFLVRSRPLRRAERLNRDRADTASPNAPLDRLIPHLVEALELLAAPPEEQIAWVGNHRAHVDELALQFDDSFKPLDIDDGPLSQDQRQAIRALDSALLRMSGPENAPLWTEEGLRTSSRWKHVRLLAARALREIHP
jgi:hypothetical protein